MRYLLPLVIALSSVSCVSATIDDTVCSERKVLLPGIHSDLTLDAVQVSVEQDMSSVLEKLDNVADVKIVSVHLDLRGKVDFLHHIKVVLKTDFVIAPLVLADTDIATTDLLVNIPIVADKDTLLELLKSGTAIMTIIATGQIPQENTLTTASLCVDIEARTTKAVWNIK